jgi:TetR/AcrR family transcriptional regulator, transcriptional repressor for nem operon
LSYLISTFKLGIETGEIRREVDPRRAALLIISSLEGALTISRLERDREALLGVQSHLHGYLDGEMRIPAR